MNFEESLEQKTIVHLSDRLWFLHLELSEDSEEVEMFFAFKILLCIERKKFNDDQLKMYLCKA